MSGCSDPAEAAAADMAMFEHVYTANAEIVYGYLLRLCGGEQGRAEELSQDTWCALVDELRAGRTDRATTQWLLTVARSRFIDRWRRDQRLVRPLKLAWVSGDPVDPWEPTRSEVIDELRMLSPEQRLVLVLRYVDELAVPEIARSIGRSVAATNSLLGRARRELRSRLIEGGAHA